MLTATDAKSNETSKQNRINLQQAFKLALSMALLYWLALALNWDLPKYGALAIALISLDTTGASLHKGVMRIVGTIVGLGVGLLGLAWFAQDPWLTLMFHASYLVVVSYFMQSSRYPYAWYVAGFLPSLVWATTYGKMDNAFSYATFRFLETSAGIIIYTAISAVVWPRQAGDKLDRQGRELWQELRCLFGLYRRQLEDGHESADASARRAQIAGTVSQMSTTLDAAYADTPSVAAHKHVWEDFRVNVRASCDAMELWRQSIDDCRHLELDDALPHVRSVLEKLAIRFERIERLWAARSASVEVGDSVDRDESLLQWQSLHVEQDHAGQLSHIDCAALSSFVQQLNVLQLTSVKLLHKVRVLAGLTTDKDVNSQSLVGTLYQPSRWDPGRFVRGLLPAVCFVVAFFFWIYFTPPTGPSVPNMAATFGLLVVLSPINALMLIPLAFVAIWGIVAPVYFFVMPRLSTGPELLALVFVFAFTISAAFVGRLAPLRSMVLVMFVMMTGISNSQSYSFTALVDGALMILLAVGIVAIVQTLFSPLKSERAILKTVRQFFRGCARVTQGYALDGSGDRVAGRRVRKRTLQSLVLPAPAKLRKSHGQLDDSRYPDNTPEKVQRLIDSLQSIANRLQALEIAHDRLDAHRTELPEGLTPLTEQVREFLRQSFGRCGRLASCEATTHTQAEAMRLGREFEEQLDVLASARGPQGIEDRLLADLYTMMGSVRGLIDAMTNAEVVINEINWRQWATPRF